ncbi:MAG: c-type cytochrome, partial [Anaerolineales bacterium]
RTVFLLTLLIVGLLTIGLAACGGGGEQAVAEGQADVANGKTIYDGLCIACHGPDGTGIEGLGKDLTTSELVKSKSDQELVEFIKEGRPATHPDNTTGIDMPPKGGNPSLTDQDLADVVAYVQSLGK